MSVPIPRGVFATRYGFGHVRSPDGRVAPRTVWLLVLPQPCCFCHREQPEGAYVSLFGPPRSHQYGCGDCAPWHVYNAAHDPPYIGPMLPRPCWVCAWLDEESAAGPPRPICTHCAGTGREPLPDSPKEALPVNANQTPPPYPTPTEH